MTKATDTPSTGPDTGQLAEQAQTEAAEIKADIQEAKEEAAEARAEGDTDRAERLEQRIDGLETKLDTALDKLTKLVERPFHPAPEERSDAASSAEGAGAQTKEAPPEEAAEETKKPRGRRPSRAFFGSRAEYDD